MICMHLSNFGSADVAWASKYLLGERAEFVYILSSYYFKLDNNMFQAYHLLRRSLPRFPFLLRLPDSTTKEEDDSLPTRKL